MYHDPYGSDRGYYECQDCGTREIAERSPSRCPDCDGWVRNIGVSRE